MALIIVATTAATATKSLSTTAAPGPVGLGLRLVDFQRASAQFRSIQRRHGFIGLGCIGHFHKSKSASAAGLPIGNYAHVFHRTVSFEHSSQFRFGCAVGQISDVKDLHCLSSLSRSSNVRDSSAFVSLVSGSALEPQQRTVFKLQPVSSENLVSPVCLALRH